MTRRQRIIRAASVAVLASAIACETPTVPRRDIAYNFTFEGFGVPLIYRWADGEEIGVYVVPTSDPERAGQLEAAVRQATDAWNDAVLFDEFELVAADLEDADVVVAWANETLPVDTEDCPPAPGGLAWTTFCLDSTLTPNEVAASSQTLRGVHAYPLTSGEHNEDGVHMILQVLHNASEPERVYGLVTHELGHVLGIGTHPCDYADPPSECPRGYGAFESVMYIGLPQRDTPARADRETIELLYRTRPHLVP